MRTATLSTLLCSLIAGCSAVPHARALDEVTAGPSFRSGELAWHVTLRQRRDAQCRPTAMRDGLCPSTWYVRMHNDSQLPIQCGAALEFAPREYSSRFRSPRYRVVMADSYEVLIEESQEIAAAAWRAQEFRCALVPASLPAAPPADAGCTVEPPAGDGETSAAKKLEEFIPPGAFRRQESGDVIIDLTFAANTVANPALAVVRSSGFESLDNAALRLVEQLSASAGCADRTLRRTVRFDKPVKRMVSPDFGFVTVGVHLID